MVEMGPTGCTTGSGRSWTRSTASTSPANPYENAILDYHGTSTGWSAGCSSTPTTTRSSSSSPTTARSGWTAGSAINEWLRREGLLATLVRARRGSRRCATSASTGRGTTAWGEGGYYARVFLNVAGPRAGGRRRAGGLRGRARRPRRRLAAIPDDAGRPIATRVYKPEELYEEVDGVAPDLIVLFGDLLWRSVGTIGGDEGVHTFENDTGPDDANHAQDGL